MSKNIKPPKFNTVEECLEWIPDPETVIAGALRYLIIENLPHATERLSYNVPYYFGKRRICFIWPASVVWGNMKTYEGIRLGFCQGHLMSDDIGFLKKENRKQVCWRDFRTVEQVANEIDMIKAYIFEAADIDQKF